MSKKVFTALLVLLALFVLIRLPGIDLPYHQDEWKNVAASHDIESAGKFFAHPPFQQMMYVFANEVLGDDGMRFLPLIFAVGSAILLFLLLYDLYVSKYVATWGSALYLLCFYSVWGSLMVDVDGSVLPFFFLLAFYTYNRFVSTTGHVKWRWFTLVVLAVLFGFLFKLSFILVVGALVIDYFWHERMKLSLRRREGWIYLAKMMSTVAGFTIFYVLILLLIQKIYPQFSIELMLGHAGQHGEESKNWIQIPVQAIKSIFYLSPLLIVPLLWLNKESWIKMRVFALYLIVGFIFYFIVFDFSRAALDKYLMFVIVPLSALAGAALANILHSRIDWKNDWKAIVIAAVGSVALLLVNFLPHEVLPLYPKTLWFSKFLTGDWIMLNPFHGGSGPLGFYVSFLFIALTFIISFLAVAVSLWKKTWRKGAAIVVVSVGILYNGIFIEELLFGTMNGNAPEVLANSIKYIRDNEDIDKVLTYNDIGAGPLSQLSKYAGRIYAIPASEEGYRKKFSEHIDQGGHFFLVEVPLLYDGFYSDFFSKCDTLFETRSGVIPGRVYSCKHP